MSGMTFLRTFPDPIHGRASLRAAGLGPAYVVFPLSERTAGLAYIEE
jgi:hypothetical protein